MEVLTALRRRSVEHTTLRSRFGRRLLLLFVSLALAPILALAVVTYSSVSRELRSQSDARLRDQAKSHTMAVLERLALLDGELALLTRGYALGSLSELPPELVEPLAERFRSLATLDAGTLFALHGRLSATPPLTSDQRLHLGEGRALMIIEHQPNQNARILMARSVAPSGELARGVLWGEIEPAYLWWGRLRQDHLPPFTALWVFDFGGRSLFSSAGDTAALDDNERSQIRSTSVGQTTWRRAGTQRKARFRSVPLAASYGLSGFTVVMAESEQTVNGPLRKFRMLVLPVFLVTLWVVVLLSLRQIRRNLEPLARLRTGAGEIAKSNFSTRVNVRSGDEFEDLAGAFNQMAERLGSQFESLSALTEVQSSVLSAQGRSEIAWAVLSNLGRLLPTEKAQLTVFEAAEIHRSTVYAWPERSEQSVRLHTEDQWWLEQLTDLTLVRGTDEASRFLTDLAPGHSDALVVLPIVLDDRVAGVITAHVEPSWSTPRDVGPLHQLGDQVALALSKASLIEELETTNRGTLAALARTIDANSRWTHGHSERVAALALRVGDSLGLEKRSLDILERGALLHDIGKLGVPSALLNKPSRLTAEELVEVRRHVEIGARILEPVPSLEDLLPLVRQHHERFDGGGYPQGLAGQAIHPLARVLAVVDVYDALRSARPYRAALPHDVVVSMLTRESGRQFDPKVVTAFLDVLETTADEEDSEEIDSRSALA